MNNISTKFDGFISLDSLFAHECDALVSNITPANCVLSEQIKMQRQVKDFINLVSLYITTNSITMATNVYLSIDVENSYYETGMN